MKKFLLVTFLLFGTGVLWCNPGDSLKMPGVNVSRETAIRRAKAWGCYKDEKPWQTFTSLDTANHYWEVGCMKKVRPPFKYIRPTYYDEKIITK